MRLALVANSGSGKGVEAADLRRLLEREGAEVVLCEQGWKGDEATRAKARGADRIVAAGGDGTVGGCAALARDLGVPLALIPMGTANDFARDQELPVDVEEACRLAVHGRRTRRLELASMGDRSFVNAASAGLSPLAAQRAAPLKRLLGPGAYPAGAVMAGLTGRPLRCDVRTDGREAFSGRAWQVIVAATGAFGGGAEIDAADPQDGRLDLVAVPAGSRLALPLRAVAMLRGDLAARSGVVHRRADRIEVELVEGAPFNVDGELVACDPGVLQFGVEDSAYAIVVP